MNERPIQNQIDGCQPDSAEADHLIAEHGLEEVAERLHAVDRAIQTALNDVSVPSGLEDRLLHAVLVETDSAETAQSTQLLSDPSWDAIRESDLSAEPEVALKWSGSAERTEDSRRLSRRYSVLGLVSAVAVTVAVVVLWQPASVNQAPASASELANKIGQWMPELELALADKTGWQAADLASPEGYQAGREVLPPLRGWRVLSHELDSQTILWDLSSRRRGEAYLLVLKPARQFSLPDMPLRRLTSSGPWSLGAWQQGDTLYVLIGGRGVRSLEQLVRRPELG